MGVFGLCGVCFVGFDFGLDGLYGFGVGVVDSVVGLLCRLCICLWVACLAAVWIGFDCRGFMMIVWIWMFGVVWQLRVLGLVLDVRLWIGVLWCFGVWCWWMVYLGMDCLVIGWFMVVWFRGFGLFW